MELKPIEQTIAEVKLTKATDAKPKNISFSFTLNGVTTSVMVRSVLEALKELSASISPRAIKTMGVFHVQYEDRIYHRILKVQPMKMLLGNESRRLMVAKTINNNLGITGEDLYK